MIHRLIIVAILICSNAQASVVMKPIFDDYGYSRYSWLNKSTNYYSEIKLFNDAEKIISEGALKDIFTLQLRNYLRDLKLVDYSDSDDELVRLTNKWLYLYLDLRKYNEHNTIYFGSLSLRIMPDINTASGRNPEHLKREAYVLSFPIANSEKAIRDTIQS